MHIFNPTLSPYVVTLHWYNQYMFLLNTWLCLIHLVYNTIPLVSNNTLGGYVNYFSTTETYFIQYPITCIREFENMQPELQHLYWFLKARIRIDYIWYIVHTTLYTISNKEFRCICDKTSWIHTLICSVCF